MSYVIKDARDMFFVDLNPSVGWTTSLKEATRYHNYRSAENAIKLNQTLTRENAKVVEL